MWDRILTEVKLWCLFPWRIKTHFLGVLMNHVPGQHSLIPKIRAACRMDKASFFHFRCHDSLHAHRGEGKQKAGSQLNTENISLKFTTKWRHNSFASNGLQILPIGTSNSSLQWANCIFTFITKQNSWGLCYYSFLAQHHNHTMPLF